jgi:hypothetical protein
MSTFAEEGSCGHLVGGRHLWSDLRMRPSRPVMSAELTGVSITNGPDCTAQVDDRL